MHIYHGDLASFASSPVVLSPQPDDQVLVLDYNGDLRLDLYGSVNGVRTVWINTANDDGTYSFVAYVI